MLSIEEIRKWRDVKAALSPKSRMVEYIDFLLKEIFENDQRHMSNYSKLLQTSIRKVEQLESELDFAVTIMCAEQDELNPDQLKYLMSARQKQEKDNATKRWPLY